MRVVEARCLGVEIKQSRGRWTQGGFMGEHVHGRECWPGDTRRRGSCWLLWSANPEEPILQLWLT